MAWALNPALTTFRNEVNAAYPRRDKASDGTIGDAAHQAGTSDHNPDADGSVDAWDMDTDLRSGNDAAEIERLKQVFQRHPAARYWIHNRQIAHRNNGWKRERYTGSNPHDKHVHWNSEPAHEDSTRPWGVQEEDLQADERTALFEIRTMLKGAEKVNWATTNRALALLLAEDAVYTVEGQPERTEENALGAVVKALATDVAEIKAKLETPPGTVTVTDEQLERVLRKVVGSVDEAA